MRKKRWLKSENINFLKNLGRMQIVDGVVNINPSEYEEIYTMIDNAIFYLKDRHAFDSIEYDGLLQLHSDLEFFLNDKYVLNDVDSNKASVKGSLISTQEEAIKRLFG